MAIQNLYPAIRPSLDLNFAGSKTVDPRITFTRASSATYFDEFGVMRTASNNVPRIDHSPLTGECLGLLIEEQRTNLLTYSEQFNKTAWVKSAISIAQNAVIAPDGTLAADKIIESAAAGQHYISQSVSVQSNTSYAPSVFVKAAERTKCRVIVAGSDWSSAAAADIDLTNGTLLYSTGTVYVVPAGNGWYRVSIVGVTGSTTALRGLLVLLLDSANNASYTGDGTSGIYVWGAQLEEGAFPTSYIKTEASQVTRAFDSTVMTGSNFSSWYSQSEGAFFVNALSSSNATVRFLSVNSGSAQNRTDLLKAATGQIQLLTMSDGALTTSNQVTVGAFSKVAAAYKANDIAVSLNSGAVVTDSTASLPSAVQINIGATAVDSGILNGYIKRLTYYPRRLSNDQLVALTS